MTKFFFALLLTITVAGCAGVQDFGPKYEDVYNVCLEGGKTSDRCHQYAQNYCLSNVCSWGK